jgi:hypothetical protein
MTINPVTRFHKNHHHKISTAMAAAGIGLIIFPEPVISDVIGLTLIGFAMLFAFFSDYIHRK